MLERNFGDLKGTHELLGFDGDSWCSRHNLLPILPPGDPDWHVSGGHHARYVHQLTNGGGREVKGLDEGRNWWRKRTSKRSSVFKIQTLHGLQCNTDPITLQKCTRTYTLTHIPPLQPIIAALIRAQLAWGIMALPWKQRWGASSETSGGFNLGLVKIQLIKSETWQDKQHTILTSHWSQCSVVPVHTLMQTHTLDLAVFVPGAVAPCMDTHGEVKIQNPKSLLFRFNILEITPPHMLSTLGNWWMVVMLQKACNPVNQRLLVVCFLSGSLCQRMGDHPNLHQPPTA